MESKLIKSVLLVFLEGENQGSEVRMNPPRTLEIGRSEECGVFLGEKKISRKHSKITVEEDRVVLEDLQSTNGTLLNKKQVKEPMDLSSEDMIQVGTSLIKVVIDYQESVKPEPKKPEPAYRDRDIKTDFEGSSGVMSIEEDLSKSMGMSALTRERSVVSNPVSKPMSSSPISNPSEKKAKTLSGDLSAMGLADLLQNLSQNAKSGNLSLNGNAGEICIVDGKILAAKTGAVHGRKALFRMLSWNEGEFELLPLAQTFRPTDIKQPINESIENLLMEGFRQFDELEKMKKKLPPLQAKLRLKSDLEAPLSKLHPKVLDLLQVIIRGCTFGQALDQTSESDLEISKMIYYLLKKEYIEVAY